MENDHSGDSGQGEAHFFHFGDDATALGSVSNALMLVQLLEQVLHDYHWNYSVHQTSLVLAQPIVLF